MTLHTLAGACVLVALSAPAAHAANTGAAQAPRQRPAAAPQAPAAERATPTPLPTGMSPRAEAYHQFMIGRTLEADGDEDGAAKAYLEAARLDPKSAEIRAELSSLYARENKFQEAVTQAEAALALDADNVGAHRVLGLLYGSLARVDEGSAPLSGEAAGYAAKAVEHLDAARRHAEVTDPPFDMMLAQIYMRTGAFDKAIEVLRHLTNDEPGRPEPVNLLLQAYDKAGRADDTLTLLELVAPEQPQFYGMLAEQYSRRQRWADSARAYEQAVAANPRNAELKMRLAAVLLSDGSDRQAARAVDLLQPLRKDNPADGRVLYFLAEAQRRAGFVDDSAQTARALIKVDPTALTGPYALAQALEAKQDFRAVVEALDPVVSKPAPAGGIEVAPLFVHLGFAYVELGEFDKAVAAFEGARKASPANPAVDLYILQAQVSAKRYPDAIALARKLRSAYPGEQRVVRLEAEALRSTGKAAEGAALLSGALDTHPDDVAAFLALADYQSQAGNVDAALQVIDRAAAKFPSDLAVVFQAGAIYDRHKRFAEAERKFRDVLAKDPLHAQALNYLGYMLADRGERLDEAVGYIKRALAVEPTNGSYLDSLGWALYRQNKFDDAEPYLEKAAAQRLRGSAVQDHFGDLLFKLGRFDEAVTAWQRALAGDGEQIDRAAIDRKIRSAREKAPRK